MKTLIVEDNADDLRILRYYLERHGCDVIEARDGAEGLDLAKIHRPSLIISDALMPRMDGFQLLRCIRMDENLKSIPFIFYSAVYTGNKEAELAVSIGADAYIVKPKEPEEFWVELQKILEGGKLKEQPERQVELIEEDEEYLRKYSNIVATKLEEKVRDLEKAIDLYRQAEKKISLLTAINSVFSETLACETEEEVARICLKVAEDLTGSQIGFIGELNEEGFFDTTTLSEAGWNACNIPRPEAEMLLKRMPNRGINRIGLRESRSWIVNNAESHPEAVEKPAGHPVIRTFLGVPMFFLGGAIGMIALANKHPGYTEADMEDMEVLSAAFVEALNRRRAERKIRELNEELKKNVLQAEVANKELEAFSYSVSHDLRAPLRHITGFVELLNKRDLGSLDGKSRHYLDVISESARKMGILIDDLLAFSRIGRAEMKKTGIDFAHLVRGVVDELKADEKDRDISWEIAPLPTVAGDAALLRLVMINLVGNALKFTRPRVHARIEIGAITDSPDETLIYVRDNGVGFDMRYVDKLFGLFQRLHAAEDFEGTGIGLANVQRIIHRHGGRVWAEGELDGGSVFWFSLPKNPAGITIMHS
jgi:signal transduction histidine kinase/DNA-binding response OmpR family regulator